MPEHHQETLNLNNSPLRISITVISWVVVIAFLAALFFTDSPAWPLLVGTMAVLIPTQIYLRRTKNSRWCRLSQCSV
ncbi:hypothetical protein QP028_15345 [Corynebacterium suedekumii]|nr:hypothetical protein QP028_15345 [Corynebacterium suedekumii]